MINPFPDIQSKDFIITFKRKDMVQIGKISKDRNRRKSDSNIQSYTYGKHDDNTIHQIGMMGELSFAMLFGLDTDFTYKPGGDIGFDFTLPTGYTVDVKTRLHDNYTSDLLTDDSNIDVLKADIYVLAIADIVNKWVQLVGWCFRKDFKKHGELEKRAKPPKLYIPRCRLRIFGIPGEWL